MCMGRNGNVFIEEKDNTASMTMSRWASGIFNKHSCYRRWKQLTFTERLVWSALCWLLHAISFIPSDRNLQSPGRRPVLGHGLLVTGLHRR